jgi:ArsR family transcriptional regulator
MALLSPETPEAVLFSALAHPARLEILELLRQGEQCVCHLQAVLDHRQAYISQQLNILRTAGLVTARKDRQRVYYRASHPSLYQVIDGAQALLQVQGRWQAPPASKIASTPHRPCNCPQCASAG